MAAVEAGFKKSFFQISSGTNLENVSVSVEQKEAIWNIVIFKRDTLIFFD